MHRYEHFHTGDPKSKIDLATCNKIILQLYVGPLIFRIILAKEFTKYAFYKYSLIFNCIRRNIFRFSFAQLYGSELLEPPPFCGLQNLIALICIKLNIFQISNLYKYCDIICKSFDFDFLCYIEFKNTIVHDVP